MEYNFNQAITDFVATNYSLEQQEVIVEVLSLLQRLNINSYESFTINLISDYDNKDPIFITDTFFSYLEGFLINLEKNFGFELLDQEVVSLGQRVSFIRGYVDLEDYIDHVTVVRICETDSNLEEKLAEAVALTCELGEETLLSMVKDVQESAIYTLQQIHLAATPNNELVEETVLPTVSEGQLINLKAFIFLMKEKGFELEVVELIRQGYDVGLPFNIYFNKIKDTLFEKELNVLSIEFFAVLLMSKEYWSNPVLAFTTMIEQFVNNAVTINALNNQIRQLANEFDLFKANNRIKVNV